MQITSDIATCMYCTGIDPFSGEEVYTTKYLNDCKLQRVLLQFSKADDDSEVRDALMKAGRRDLIPAKPPKAAVCEFGVIWW